MMVMRKIRRIQVKGGAVALTALLTACSGATTVPPEQATVHSDGAGILTIPAHSPLRAQLQVGCVSARPVARQITLPASVELPPEQSVQITSPLAGRVRTINVAVGDHVTKGQVIAVLTSSDMAQAYADRIKAADALALSQQSLARARQVHAAGGAAQKDVEAAQSAFVQARAEAQRASARLVELGAATPEVTDALQVKAPISGVVTQIATAPGALLPDTATVFMRLENHQHVWITAQLAEDLSADVSVGQDVQVTFPTAFPQRVMTSRLATIDAVVQPDTHHIAVHALLDNPEERFRPNLFATMRIATTARMELRIPPSALLMNNDHTDVFVQVTPWRFERRRVAISDDAAASIRVTSGLRSGECIVTQGGILLND